MRAAQTRAVQFKAQTIDQRAGLGQGFQVTGVGVHRHHRFRAAGELDFGHDVKSPAQAFPGVG
ncbi:hypothetical protein D3C81_1418500 [compost metagenome]